VGLLALGEAFTGVMTGNTVMLGRRLPQLPSPFRCRHCPDTCKQGFVWREAFGGDTVCVTPAVRQQAANDNAAAASRKQANAPAPAPAPAPNLLCGLPNLLGTFAC
jgi:hypothetical protein